MKIHREATWRRCRCPNSCDGLNLGIATAQTAEEGIANFYSDKFSERNSQRRSLRQEQTHCVAQDASLRNQGQCDKMLSSSLTTG